MSVGKELVRRLKGFTEKLEGAEKMSDKFTCRTIRLNLQLQEYSPELVKETRGILRASQVIFARFLGVSPNAVRDWEQGVKPPSGAACRIMDEIRQDPKYWIARLQALSKPATSG